ncbi:hypothetical protein [Rhodanobacter sp. L36]|uniref:hypothetical protein n=1 Tax=Rhodanobacter sp. L36 TaxID=1747221 RepID=UPI00131D24B6|nr:hypothetical protein [Rhodanobacter sp. L36]
MTNYVAAGISFFGTEHAISDQIAADKHDAQVAQFNADTTLQQGQAADQAMARDIASTQGKMAAGYSGSGVTMDGSPNAALADSIRRGVLDRSTQAYNYNNTALNYMKQKASLLLLAHNTQRTQFATASAAGLASFGGGNGGMDNAGQNSSGNDTYNLGGNNSSFSSDMSSVGGNSSSFMNDMNSAGGISGDSGGDYGYLGSGNSTGYYSGGNSLTGGTDYGTLGSGSSSGGWGD